MGDHPIGITITANAEQAVAGFNQTIAAANSVERTIKQLGKSGTDSAALLAKVGETGPPAVREFARSAEAASMPLDQLKAKLQELNNAARTEAREASKAIADQAAAYQTAASMAGQFAGAIKSISGPIAEAGKQAATLDKSLKIAFRGDSIAAGGAKEAINNVRLAIGATPEELLKATQGLQKFGVFSEENLKRAAIAAKETGQSVDTVAEAIGRFEKFGDTKSANKLKGVLGIDPQEVAKAAGVLDAHGKILLDTAEKRRRFNEEMNKAIDAKNGKGMDDLTSAAQKTRTEFAMLQEEIGVSYVKAQNQAAAAAQPLVHALREMPDWMKAGAGTALSMSGSLAGMAGTGLQVAANLKLMGFEWKGLIPMIGSAASTLGGFASTAAAFIGVGGGVVIAIAALGAATYAYTQQLQDNEKAEQALLVMREKQFGPLTKYHALIGKTADELAREGHTSKETAARILLLHEAREAASKTGNKEEVARIQAEIDGARKQHVALAELDLKKKQAAEKEAQEQKASAEHGLAVWNNYKQRVTAGYYETKEAHEKALLEAGAALKNHGQAWTQEALEKAGVEKESIKAILKAQDEANLQRTKAHRETADERTKNEKASLDTQHELHKIGTAEYIAGLQRILAAHKGSVAERQALEKSISTAQAKQVEERVKAEEQAVQIDLVSGKITLQQAADRYKALAHMAGLTQQQIGEITLKGAEKQKEADAQSLKGELHVLETRRKNGELSAADESNSLRSILASHKLTAEQRIELENKLSEATKAAVTERHNHEMALLQQRKAAGKATLSDEAALLERQSKDAGLTQEQRDSKATAAAEKRKEIEDHRVSQQQALAKVQEDLLKKEEGHLQERMGKGEDVAEALIANKRKQYDMERAEIQRTAAEERKKYGDTAEGQAILKAKLQDLAVKEQDDIRTVNKARQEYLKGILDKLDAIDKKQKEMAGFKMGGQGIDKAFEGDSNLGFTLTLGQGKDGNGGLPPGMNVEELRRLVAGNPDDPRVAAAYSQATRGGKNSSEVPTIADGSWTNPGAVPRTADVAMGGAPTGTTTAAPSSGEPPRGGSIAAAVSGGQSATNIYITATNVHVQGGQANQMGDAGQSPSAASSTRSPGSDTWQSRRDFDRDLHFSHD